MKDPYLTEEAIEQDYFSDQTYWTRSTYLEFCVARSRRGREATGWLPGWHPNASHKILTIATEDRINLPNPSAGVRKKYKISTPT